MQNELLQFRSNPAAVDGGRFVGGEQGYVFPAHLCTSEWAVGLHRQIAHNPAPDAIKSEAEKRLFLQQYPA